ncbi:MAG: hypothetical protein QMD21_07325 [Candidatus Thermoplasmatota archaeon]|nr:hypothetical protein [Candidatus Thermoplasmatota archaeon]
MDWSKEPHDATLEELILAYAEGKTEEELIEEVAQEYDMHPIRKAQLWTRIQNLIAQCMLSVDQNGKLKVRR